MSIGTKYPPGSMSPDGVPDRAFWDPVAQAERHISQMSAGYGPRSGRMEAQDRLDDIRKSLNGKVREAQEKYFRALPTELRKTILSRVAEYELNQRPQEFFATDEIADLENEANELRRMLYGPHHGECEENPPQHPYPLLDGIPYSRLSEIDLDATIDKTVT